MIEHEREHEVLMQDGHFRLVRTGDMVFIQHEHTTRPTELGVAGNPRSWDKWVYCWCVEMECKLCETKVPKAMQGLYSMTIWSP